MPAIKPTAYNPARHWLDKGWWEVRCSQCDFRCTAPNLFYLRRLLATGTPGRRYIVIRRAGSGGRFRERFRLSAVLSASGRLICGRVASPAVRRRTQHKGGT